MKNIGMKIKAVILLLLLYPILAIKQIAKRIGK